MYLGIVEVDDGADAAVAGALDHGEGVRGHDPPKARHDFLPLRLVLGGGVIM